MAFFPTEKKKNIFSIPVHHETALFGLHANSVEYVLLQTHLTDSLIYSHYKDMHVSHSNIKYI